MPRGMTVHQRRALLLILINAEEQERAIETTSRNGARLVNRSKALRDEGMIEVDGATLRLTEAGRVAALEIKRAVAETFDALRQRWG